MHHPGGHDHLVFLVFIILIQGFFPEISVAAGVLAVSLDAFTDDGGLFLQEIADADHGVAAGEGGGGDQFHLPVDPDGTVIVHQVADHVPGIEFAGAVGILVAPDVAGDDVGVGEMPQRPFQGMEVVLCGVLRVDDQCDIESVDQVLIFLLHKTDDHIDLPDPGFVELADRPLDQRFAVDLQEALGDLHADRDHAHAETGG